MKEIIKIATYEDYKQEFDRQFLRKADTEVAIGYLLKLARDTDILRNSGYTTMRDFAKKEYGITADKASLYMGIQERFANPEIPHELDPKYAEYESSKLAAMMTIPDETILLLDPDMKREEIREVARQIKQENQITDLEVMLEEKPEEQGMLRQTMKTYFADHRQQFEQLFSVLWQQDGEEKAAEVLAPGGMAVLMSRVTGKGRMMVSIRGTARPVEIQNIRTLETESYAWPDFLKELRELYSAVEGLELEAAWRKVYGEIAPAKDPEYCMGCRYGQPVDSRSKALSYQAVCDECKEGSNFRGIQQEEQIPGQDTILNHPEWMPDRGEEDSCPPEIGQCIRQEWGASPEQQQEGKEECKRFWDEYKKRAAILGKSEPEEKLSAYGLPIREYPEGSLLTCKGCGTHACFNCHQIGCEIRQESCHCVEAPLGNPFPCEMLEQIPAIRESLGEGCQFLDYSLAYHRAGDRKPVPCCKNCENLCEYACSRTRKALEQLGGTVTEQNGSSLDNQEQVIDGEFREVEEPEIVEYDRKTLEHMIKNTKDTLKEMSDYWIQNQPFTYAKYAMQLQAYKMLMEHNDQASIVELHEQPGLPIMKNNDQRREWLRNYKDWGIWYEDKNIGAKYYRYEFENGAELIVDEYVKSNEYAGEWMAPFYHLVGGPEPPKGSYGEGKWTKHEKYERYPNSETELVEFLKFIQKSGD